MKAVLSPDEQHRYALWRDVQPQVITCHRPVLFVMLNPSTADATVDDATIRRCIRFAGDWGYARLAVVNLYSARATDPRALDRHPQPIGPDTDRWITDVALEADRIVCAWGAHAATRPKRVARVLELLRSAHPFRDEVYCLGLTASGHPRHPCRLPANVELELYEPDA